MQAFKKIGNALIIASLHNSLDIIITRSHLRLRQRFSIRIELCLAKSEVVMNTKEEETEEVC